jgi:hypothetical protein
MKIQVEFKGDSGNTMISTFDRDSGTVTSSDGRAGTYTRTDGARGIEIKNSGGQAVAITFAEDFRPEKGFSTRYASALGDGTATILAVD